MEKQEKILAVIMKGTSDANISFNNIRSSLLYFGFDERPNLICPTGKQSKVLIYAITFL
jgi:hypothetical protein